MDNWELSWLFWPGHCETDKSDCSYPQTISIGIKRQYICIHVQERLTFLSVSLFGRRGCYHLCKVVNYERHFCWVTECPLRFVSFITLPQAFCYILLEWPSFQPVLAAVIWLFLLNPLGLSHDKHELWPLCSSPRWFGFFNFFLFNIFALFPFLFFPLCSLFYFLPRQGLLGCLGSILVFLLKYNTDAENHTNQSSLNFHSTCTLM